MSQCDWVRPNPLTRHIPLTGDHVVCNATSCCTGTPIATASAGANDRPTARRRPARRQGHSWSRPSASTSWTWPPDYDNTDINMVARSHEVKGYGRYVACATDFGGVLLFNYPAVVKNGPHYWYPGHSSHTKNIKWLAPLSPLPPAEGEAAAGDQSAICYCMSAGGHDRSFQWPRQRRKPRSRRRRRRNARAPSRCRRRRRAGRGSEVRLVRAEEDARGAEEPTTRRRRSPRRRKLLELERGFEGRAA